VTVEDFDEFIDDVDSSVIAAFQEKEIIDPKAVKPEGWDDDEDGEWSAPTIENPVLTAFNSVSGANYGYRFAYTTAPEVLAKLKCKSQGLFLYRSPKFVSPKDGDRPRERFPSAELSDSAVSNWLKAKAQPLVGIFNHNTKERYAGPVLVVFMNLDFEKNEKTISYVLKRMRKVAAGYKPAKGAKGLAFAVAPLADMSYELGDYGLASKSTASDVLFGIRTGSNYDFTYYSSAEFDPAVKFDAKSLGAFAEAFSKGELKPYVKPAAEPEPPADDDEPSDEEAEEPKDEM